MYNKSRNKGKGNSPKGDKMTITNFKTFVNKACDGCESIAYRYLDEIAKANGVEVDE